MTFIHTQRLDTKILSHAMHANRAGRSKHKTDNALIELAIYFTVWSSYEN